MSGNEIGRALYHLLKSGEDIEPLYKEEPLVLESHTETRRVTRLLPDGSIEIIEQSITDERIY